MGKSTPEKQTLHFGELGIRPNPNPLEIAYQEYDEANSNDGRVKALNNFLPNPIIQNKIGEHQNNRA
jgi:hypothetical protein